ncbi:MAG: ribonuclease P protein component [Bacteroidales bacterium]|nr:ribonuclease P protein component [Bacteroidales bacterium]
MSTPRKNIFKKEERLCSRTLIDFLFQEGNYSAKVYPIRAVFMSTENHQQEGVSVLISVPKKRLRHAIDRNRVKRQLREAYRKNKHTLTEQVRQSGKGLAIVFIYVSTEIEPSNRIEKRMVQLLDKIGAEL